MANNDADNEHMTRVPFGPTGLTVSPVCIGCAQLGDMPETFDFSVDEAQALDTLRAVFSSPINFLDTAANYADGESERRIGAVLREMRGLPKDYVLATKADRDMKSGDFSGDQMKRSIENSLENLGVESFQVLYLHDPEHSSFDYITADGGALDTLRDFVDQGVIRHLGIAGGPIDLMIEYVETGAFEAVISHNRYTLLYRTADPLFQMASERGLAVVNAAPYGSGILGKGPDEYPRYMYGTAGSELIERVRELDAICQRHAVPLAAVALQFSLRDPRICSTIVGMSRPDRIQATLDLAAVDIPDDLWDEIADVPYWDGEPVRSG